MNKHTPTILIVEDEKSLLKVWSEIFRKEGLNVLTAQDAQSALSLALRWRPDLLVVDLVMSADVIKRLRENKWGQKVPVMFLSGWLSPEVLGEPEEDENQNTELGDYYFHDNWNFDQVVKEVRNKLRLVQLKTAAF